MSRLVEVKGYSVINGAVIDIDMHQWVFDYPSGTLSVSPTAGNTETPFAISVNVFVDSAALPVKQYITVNGIKATLNADGSYRLLAGSNVITAEVQDANGISVGTNSVTVSVTNVVVPPKSKTRIGSSTGSAEGGSVALTLAQMPKCQALRVYAQAPTLVAAAKDFREAVAAMKLVGGEVLYSFKSMPVDAAFITVLADWAKAGCKIRWCYNHEADNPAKNINAAQFVKDFEHLITVANAHPSPTVEEYSCFMAYVLDPKQPHGDPDSWYVPSARTMGFDDYVLVNYPRVVAYCKSKGKPFILPEWGGGGNDDNAALAFSKSMVAMWADNPPQVACWFNATGTGASTALKNIPKTTAFLNSLIG